LKIKTPAADRIPGKEKLSQEMQAKMVQNMKKKYLLLILTVFIINGTAYSSISEKELKDVKSAFLSSLAEDNAIVKSRIIEYLDGVVKDEKAGIRFFDKLAIFLYDSRNEGVRLKKSRFFSSGKIFSLFLVFQDDNDGQIYNLFLEYEYNKVRKQSTLKDIYFSLVFEEKMKQMRKYFKYR